MSDRFCTGCQRYQPTENMRRKRLPSGGVRLICTGCIARSRARSDDPDNPKPSPSKPDEPTT